MGGWPPTKLPLIPGVSVHRTHVLSSSRLRTPSAGGVGPESLHLGSPIFPGAKTVVVTIRVFVPPGRASSARPSERRVRAPCGYVPVVPTGTLETFVPAPAKRPGPTDNSPPSRPSSPVSAAAPPPSPPAPSSCGRLPPDRPGSTGATRLRARSSRRGRRESPGRVGQAARATEAMAASSGARELTGSPSCRLR
jgi:hypothetical protein